MSEWIRVDDRLPNDGETVLCKQVNNESLMLCYIDNGIWKEDYQDIYVSDGYGCIDNEICAASDCSNYLRMTHWTPLPEPPKQKPL